MRECTEEEMKKFIQGFSYKASREYLLFCGCNHYPCGGYEDFRGRFVSLELAIEFIEKNYESRPDNEWAHVVHNDQIIKWGYGSEGKWTWRDEE